MRAEMISYYDLVMQLFLQLAVILAACRVAAVVGARLGQARVVSEMVAGVLIGPSLFGWLFPNVQPWLFPTQLAVAQGGATVTIPHPSMTILYAISQVGPRALHVRGRNGVRREALGRPIASTWVVSVAGIVAPLALGGGIALALLDGAGLLPHPASRPAQAVLYLGRRDVDHRLPDARAHHPRARPDGTPLGTLTLAAGSHRRRGRLVRARRSCSRASTARGSVAVLAIGGGVAYAARGAHGRPPLLAPLEARVAREGRLTAGRMAIVLLLLMIDALVHRLDRHLRGVRRLHHWASRCRAAAAPRRSPGARSRSPRLFLLPIFFVYSGLNTRVGLVNRPVALVALARAPRSPWRSSARASPAGSPRALDGRARARRPRSAYADERARADGADHPEHRPRAGRHRADPVHDHGPDGHRHHADGVAALRADLRAAGAGTSPTEARPDRPRREDRA